MNVVFNGLMVKANRAINHAEFYEGQFKEGFLGWLKENVHIYLEFERRALQVAARRPHYSARTIVEVLRHETAIGELSGDYKINDHSTPDMARLFAQLNPQYGDLFEFRREKRTEKRAA